MLSECVLSITPFSLLSCRLFPRRPEIKYISDNTKDLLTRSTCADAAGVVCRGEVTVDCSVYGPSVRVGCSLRNAFLVNIWKNLGKQQIYIGQGWIVCLLRHRSFYLWTYLHTASF